MAKIFTVGLTGGIGSGKTTASDYFKRLGIEVIDADVISRQLTAAGGAAIEAIRATFGDRAVAADFSMNRAYMRQLVFNHPTHKQQLEAILHPMIGKQIHAQLSVAASPYAILSIPLLTESSHWLSAIDRLLVIDLPEDEQIRRVCKRSNLTEEQVLKIIRTQSPRSLRLRYADDVVVNTGSTEQLFQCLGCLHATYKLLANA